MPQNIHLEMVTTKTECPVEPSGEMGPHEIALRANAAELARNSHGCPVKADRQSLLSDAVSSRKPLNRC